MDQPGMVESRPLPGDTEVSAPYWDGLRAGRLLLQRCGACADHQFPPEHTCGSCGSPDLAWVEAAGDATLYSWTIAHPPLLPYFAAHGPWPVVAVELPEGVRMVTTLTGVEPDGYVIGMPLRVGFSTIADDVVVPQFEPA